MSSPRKIATAPADRLLRRALVANALFSALSAFLSMTLKTPLSRSLGIPAGELFALGLQLAVFALALLWLSSRSDLSLSRYRAAVGVVIALDVLWVLGSAVVLSAAQSPLTATGWWTVLVIALFVADFALFQFLGLRRLRRATPLGAAPTVA